jgi:CheY-like chemotaxis protein
LRDARPKVLIVEDERVTADTFVAIFSSAGYEARSVYSAEGAIDVAAGWSPDLAVVDVILPKMNGVDLAIALKEQLPSCRILLLSGQMATHDLLDKARTKGHTFPIAAKPTHPKSILKAASDLLTAR